MFVIVWFGSNFSDQNANFLKTFKAMWEQRWLFLIGLAAFLLACVILVGGFLAIFSLWRELIVMMLIR